MWARRSYLQKGQRGQKPQCAQWRQAEGLCNHLFKFNWWLRIWTIINLRSFFFSFKRWSSEVYRTEGLVRKRVTIHTCPVYIFPFSVATWHEFLLYFYSLLHLYSAQGLYLRSAEGRTVSLARTGADRASERTAKGARRQQRPDGNFITPHNPGKDKSTRVTNKMLISNTTKLRARR